ncbi:hypothetical protein [Bacillus sp. GZT]|nr:hypothetical protein [Bacillus sp. GZT]
MNFRGVAMYFYDSSPLLPRLSNYSSIIIEHVILVAYVNTRIAY